MTSWIARLTRCSGTLRRLDRIEQLYHSRSLPDLVDAVDAECAELAPSGKWGMRWLKWCWPLWKILHGGVRQHPCLYFSLLAMAYEKKAGRDGEVNVGLSTDQFDATDGHCWLTRGGNILYGMRGPSPTEYGECLGRRGHVVYWWRRTTVATRPGPHSKRPTELWRMRWPT
jgi:hypothetical protein